MGRQRVLQRLIPFFFHLQQGFQIADGCLKFRDAGYLPFQLPDRVFQLFDLAITGKREGEHGEIAVDVSELPGDLRKTAEIFRCENPVILPEQIVFQPVVFGGILFECMKRVVLQKIQIRYPLRRIAAVIAAFERMKNILKLFQSLRGKIRQPASDPDRLKPPGIVLKKQRKAKNVIRFREKQLNKRLIGMFRQGSIILFEFFRLCHGTSVSFRQ